ncbi:MAG: UDPGP type 1 family protein [Phycisphaerae bacterium]|nr:UDPGP type 1 family protein [Phycisphaerae bacterium]
MPDPTSGAPPKPDEKALRRRADHAGQEHVFRFWDDLDAERRRRLLEQLAKVDFEELFSLVREHIRPDRGPPRRVTFRLPDDLEPAPFIPLPTTDIERRRHARMRDLGETVLASGRAAALTVAGGQGTRLGYEGPKGAFPVGPVSGRTLFQVFAEGILAARRAHGAAIPWYIMTSRANDRETRDFFEAHNFFNLPRSDVRFFTQGMMPAVDFEGRLLLADRDQLAWSPDGHGGTLRALARTGMLADMRNRGIEHISYFQVDNPLVPPLDPVFLGFHADASSDMSSKMARKRDAHEKLGHFCLAGGPCSREHLSLQGGRLVVVEYSDMPDELAEARGPEGRLRFEAGSIAIHMLARTFVERTTTSPGSALPFHRADKKISCVDADGRPRKPAKPNGVKFEMFIFDALPMAQNPVVLEIERLREFSPVKNSSGEDSPATAQRDMVRLAAEWLEDAGARVPRGADGEPKHKVEISALAARSPEELKDLVRRRSLRSVAGDLYLGPADA